MSFGQQILGASNRLQAKIGLSGGVTRLIQRLLPIAPYQQNSKASTSALAMEHLDQTQVGYLKEECILVDEKDQIVGSASKGDCHKKGTASLHRAFSVFLFDPDHKLILQKRSAFKITFPGVWTNSCCSHPLNLPEEMDTNNSSSGIRNAAIRKLGHELNVTGLKPESLELAGRFMYKADSDPEWMEHELDYVLIVRNFSLPLCANLEEVEAVKRVDRASLLQMFKEGNKFSPWFQLMCESKWLEQWWKRVERGDKIENDGKIHNLN